MNKTYRSIFNAALGAWVATSEISKAHGSSCRNSTARVLPRWLLQAGNIAMAAGLAAAANSAWAACTGAAGAYSCSGTISTQQSMTGTASTGLSVTVSGATVSTSTGSVGIQETVDAGVGAGDLVYQQDSASTVSGGSLGISTFNSGNGNTTITTAGNVAGTTGDGIQVTNANSTTSMTLTANNVSGGINGINALTNGAGATNITTSGTISGASGDGITALNNFSTATDLTINQTAGSITGSNNGISAQNQGSGVTTVTAAGSVTGTSGSGILVNNSNEGTSTTVTVTGSVTGLDYGILVNGNGTGATNITTSGAVTSTSDYGVGISSSSSDDLNITQTGGSISGSYGIAAQVGGALGSQGMLNVTTAGSVAGSDGDGIIAVSIGTATDINITQTGGSISGSGSGITATNIGTGTTNITLAGSVAGGSGAGINTDEHAGTAVNITLNSGADVSATSGVGILDSAGNATLTVNSGAKVAGSILMGNGNDNVIIQGLTDISGITLLDGGNSTDTSGTTTDVLGAGATNKLGFLDTYQSVAGANLKNWESVIVDNSNVTLSDGTLVTGTGSNPDSSLQGLLLQNNATVNSTVALAVTGDVSIDATSTLTHDAGGSISGNVSNAGMIYWNHLGQVLTVNGNYTGVAGSSLSLETYLGDDTSATDKLHVTGNTSGTTTLQIRPVIGSPGAQTVNGIQVVQVDGSSAAGSFTLGTPVEAGAYQYVLTQGSPLSSQSWYLVTHFDCNLNNSCGPLTPDAPSPLPIYRPGVSGYVSGQAVNMLQGYQQLASLHQRLGDLHVADDAGRETWFRPYYRSQRAAGQNRFGYSADISGFQIGHELIAQRDQQGTSQRLGITLDYAAGNADFSDSLRSLASLDNATGSLKSQSIGLGATYTRMSDTDSYFDAVAQLSELHNRYQDSYGDSSTQNGWRLGLSVEAGKPMGKIGQLTVEPQVQLMYLYSNYESFTDQVSTVSGYSSDQLRGRVGVRLYKGDKMAGQDKIRLYGVANLIHDFTTPHALTTGGTTVEERYGRTFAELGMSGQYKLSPKGELYTDVRYQHTLGGTGAEGFQLNVGARFAF